MIREISTLNEIRYYGQRYPRHGIPSSELKFYTNPSIVVIKGMSINPAGHAFLAFGNTSSPNARFAHINAANACPEFMNPDEMKYFLNEEGGEVIDVFTPSRHQKSLLSDSDMQTCLYKLSKQNWKWTFRKHNCLSFCINVLKSGGYDIKELQQSYIDLPKFSIKRIKAGYQKLKDQKKNAIKRKKLTKRDIHIIPAVDSIKLPASRVFDNKANQCKDRS